MPDENESLNEDLCKQIRDDFTYVKDYWRENHEESAKDMDFVACIPPTDFTEDRKNRPCIWPDETSQYVKQANNNLRQNKRSVKISPRSKDAKDVDAEHRQAYIRGIEYASRGQSVYSTAAEAAIECAFGFWRIKTVITGPKGEQEPRISRIPNQFSVFPDPDALEADFSDSNLYFVLGSPLRESKFEKQYPKAKKRSFSQADREVAPGWFYNDSIVPAEYWTREQIDEKDGEKRYKVTQRITNGLEILETHEWIGSWIPIIGVFGEEIYVKHGGQVKRQFLSLIRRARAPQQMLAYVASQEAEEFGMAPRAPLLVVKGSVNPEEWKYAHKVPTAYLEYEVPQEWNAQTQGQFPPPTRVPFVPNAQAYEIARESWRRAVQAAMGITPLPTAAQRQNEKSGIALEQIQTQEAVGSYHFTDNFVRALANSGRQVNELITKLAILDSLPSQLLGKDQKDEDRILRVAPQGSSLADLVQQHRSLDPASEHLDESDFFFAHRGQFEVTISDGPSYESQREEASEFADTMFKTIAPLAQVLPPQTISKFLALVVKLRNIGVIGDEIADLLNPEDQSAAQLQQAQQQLAMAQQASAEMQAELQKLRLERAGKVIDNEYKLQLKQLEGLFESKIAQLNADLKAYIANVQTKAQSESERAKLFQETQIENHHAAHELGLQKDQQAHELGLSLQEQQHAKDLAAQQAATQPDTGAQPQV